ncbi:zinc finger, CCHC-type containing protein [Tanacetum coccineum]
MGDENPIRTLGDYSKPSHEGYRNTIELPVGNNVVPLRSDTIRLVQNGCSFHGLRSEDPNQHLKDFLKLVDSLDLDGSITTWEDLTSRFLIQLFPPGRTAKLRNDILMFQQHHGESLSKAWTRFKDLLQKVPHHGIELWLKVQIFYDHVNPVTRRTIDQSAGGKLRDRNAEESWALLEDLSLYDNETRLSKFEADFKQQQSEMTNKIDTVLKAITDRIGGTLPSNTVKNAKLNDDEPQNEGPNKGEWATMEGLTVEYFDTFLTRGNFTYIVDFMLIEDISSIIDPRLSQVVLGKPFVEISNMTHDPPKGAVRFTDGNDEVSYKMPYKIEQYNSLSNIKNEHTKSVYLMNEEDKRRGVDNVMNKILGFYKECLELGPEYVTGLDDEGEVT